MAPNLLQMPVREVMTRDPKTISGTALVEEALHKMTGTITSLFVVNSENRPVGILHIHDLLRMDVT